eukprot:gb/GEZN01004106.1/.p1 GENE.gb/GEZN01004106.1/~~gb/GEZN01004106.1/.p1  ORF type:complete len:518 (-),score=116.37 gb/GEZN01004106.1/:472-1923(-)
MPPHVAGTGAQPQGAAQNNIPIFQQSMMPYQQPNPHQGGPGFYPEQGAYMPPFGSVSAGVPGGPMYSTQLAAEQYRTMPHLARDKPAHRRNMSGQGRAAYAPRSQGTSPSSQAAGEKPKTKSKMGGQSSQATAKFGQGPQETGVVVQQQQGPGVAPQQGGGGGYPQYGGGYEQQQYGSAKPQPAGPGSSAGAAAGGGGGGGYGKRGDQQQQGPGYTMAPQEQYGGYGKGTGAPPSGYGGTQTQGKGQVPTQQTVTQSGRGSPGQQQQQQQQQQVPFTTQYGQLPPAGMYPPSPYMAYPHYLQYPAQYPGQPYPNFPPRPPFYQNQAAGYANYPPPTGYNPQAGYDDPTSQVYNQGQAPNEYGQPDPQTSPDLLSSHLQYNYGPNDAYDPSYQQAAGGVDPSQDRGTGSDQAGQGGAAQAVQDSGDAQGAASGQTDQQVQGGQGYGSDQDPYTNSYQNPMAQQYNSFQQPSYPMYGAPQDRPYM